MLKKILILIISVLSINSLSAQKSPRRIEISGTVLDVYNSPISNGLIMIDGKKTNSITNERGYYKIKVKPTALRIGVFTFGNGIYEESINDRTKININFNSSAALQSDPNLRDGEQGISSGYGRVKKRNLTTDISKIDGTDKKYSTYSSISEMIKREVSGVQVYGNNVIIQDSQNLYGYIHPLIVVDGVYMDQLPDIPPVSVKSIEVLKGASATIYGSRGYGGAIVIDTKIKNN
jgi:TonB-dependent SusC/RagA subfamily outer membrane receptor